MMPRKGLVEAQASAVRATAERVQQRYSSVRREIAVLVSVEFTGQRRKLTTAAKLARDAAAVNERAIHADEEALGSAGDSLESHSFEAADAAGTHHAVGARRS